MAGFTTWTALLDQLKNDLASGDFRTVQSYTAPDGFSATYRSIKEFWEFYNEVAQKAAAEEGLAYGDVCTIIASDPVF